MPEKTLNIENGTISYSIEQEKAIITGFQGFSANLTVPSQIEGAPVAAIHRKAFLSCKTLCSVLLPHSLEEVGDWAFAHCDSLTELSFPRQQIRFGRAVFKDCGSLKRIAVRERAHEVQAEDSAKEDCQGLRRMMTGKTENRACGACLSGTGDRATAMVSPFAELLAAAVTMLEAPYLLDIPMAGSREWLEQWDIRLLSILRAPDAEGYISQSVYGEEDYIGTDLEEFTSKKRKTKVRLSFLRLLHPQCLSPALKEELEQYLRSLTKGQSTEETWQVIRQEHGSHHEYYSLFAELGCVTEDNLDGILEDMGEDSPEMKAFFLKYAGERRGSAQDFFQGLEL